MSARDIKQRAHQSARLRLSGETVERIVEEFRRHVLKTRRTLRGKQHRDAGGAARPPAPDADSA